MKFLYVMLFIGMCSWSSMNAQFLGHNTKIYRSWTTVDGAPYHSIGVLYEAGDSSVFVSNSTKRWDYYAGNFEVSEFNIRRISTIKFRRKGKIGKGLLIGAVAGVVSGTLIGLASGDDPKKLGVEGYTAQKKAVWFGSFFGYVGAGIGVMAGSSKTKIPINRSFTNYKYNKARLRKYALKKK